MTARTKTIGIVAVQYVSGDAGIMPSTVGAGCSSDYRRVEGSGLLQDVTGVSDEEA